MRRLPLLRECGECEACCAVLSVEEIGKPDGQRCPHQLSAPATGDFAGEREREAVTHAAGCSIYRTRPAGCRTFSCLWLAECDPKLQRYAKHRKAAKIFRSEDRPDRCGVLVHPPAAGARGELRRVAVAREVWPGAADEEAGARALGRFADRMAVLLVRGERHTLMGPADAIERVAAELGIDLKERKEGSVR